MNTISKPSKFLAYVAVLVGGLLLLSGGASALGYLGLSALAPVLNLGGGLLSAQLGQMAASWLGLVGGGLAVYHGLSSISQRRSHSLRVPPFYMFWIAFALVLGAGNLLLNLSFSKTFLFPFVFALGAALPVLAVLAWVARRLGWPLTWRQSALAFVCGSTLSIAVAIVAETVLPYLVYIFILPLQLLSYGFGDVFASGGGFSPGFFFSPGLMIFLITTAFAAPIPEEFAKALTVPMFGRLRFSNARQVFLVGMWSGAGFAILENMLYEGLYANYNGWSWGGVALLRGIGAVLHPLCAGIVALGWWHMRAGGGVGRLLHAYGLAVGLHTLWNGGFKIFVYITGLGYYTGWGNSELSLYGTSIEVLLAVYLIALSLGLWWLLRRIVLGMAEAAPAEAGAPAAISPRWVAAWALACALVIVSVGAALNGLWPLVMKTLFAQ